MCVCVFSVLVDTNALVWVTGVLRLSLWVKDHIISVDNYCNKIDTVLVKIDII